MECRKVLTDNGEREPVDAGGGVRCRIENTLDRDKYSDYDKLPTSVQYISVSMFLI